MVCFRNTNLCVRVCFLFVARLVWLSLEVTPVHKYIKQFKIFEGLRRLQHHNIFFQTVLIVPFIK